jgi:hypothetical protein
VVGEREPEMATVPYEIVEVGEGVYELTLRPDPAWLQDPARVYPVYVDPSFGGPTAVYAYKSDGYSNTGTIRVGNPYQSYITHWRTILRYNYQSIITNNYQITNAYISATKTSGTVNCHGGGIYVATAFSYSGKGAYLAYFPVCASGGGGGAGLAQQIALWANADINGGHLMLTGGEYSYNTYSYKILSTTLSLDYVAGPAITGITDDTPQNGEIGVGAPVMQAEGTHAVGDHQYFRYSFTSSDGGAAWESPWVLGGPYPVPVGVLTPGKTYTYTISTMTDYSIASPIVTSANPTLYTFVTDSAPSAPANVAVTPGTGSVLTASATVSDADSDWVQALFTVKQGDLVIIDGLAGSRVEGTPPLSGASSVDLPYFLAPNTTYTLEVQAFDGHMVSTVATQNFTTGSPGAIREIPPTWDDQTGAV